jgi:hypothetical protein
MIGASGSIAHARSISAIASSCRNEFDVLAMTRSRARLSPNHDLDILVERRQQVHQSFDREPSQLVVAKAKRGDLRLRYAQHLAASAQESFRSSRT